MAGPAFDVRIDELVLHGFDPRQRVAIGAAVERELAALLRSGDARGAARAGSSSVDAGSFAVPHDAPPAVVGAHIARAVAGGLGLAGRVRR